jgi:circadian clock protein KaiC
MPQSSIEKAVLKKGTRAPKRDSLEKDFPETYERLNTGIEGLDDILNDGLPKGHLYLIEGDPGTGKTTLALQFLLEGAKNGEKGMYVTLSESKRELEQVARSHGWTTDPLVIHELIPSDEDLRPEAQYTVFHPSEVELADTIGAIVDQVEEVKPERVVLDSLAEFRMLARDPLKFRRQILALKRHFDGRNCTVLLLDDRTTEGGNNDQQLESIAHGVLRMESLERDFGIKRRRMEVNKLRGSNFRGGYHDYAIRRGGVAVYPRLVAAEHNPGFKREHVPSGIQELDDLFRGGIDTGTSTLLMGPAGCGKSTIAIRYAITAAQRGDKAVVYTFDESLASLLERSRGLGMDTAEHMKSGRLEIHQIDPAELSPGEFVHRIRRMAEDENLRVIVIDSMNGLLNAMPHEQFLALQLHELLAYLGQQGIATLMTLAQHGFMGATQTPIDVSYLADTVLLFRYFERAGSVRQALSVVKKRSGAHERTIRELIFGNGTIRVGPPLKDFEGVLSGNPTYTGHATEENGTDAGH